MSQTTSPSPTPPPPRRTSMLRVLVAFVGIALVALLLVPANLGSHDPTVPYTTFHQWIDEGAVESVTMQDRSIRGTLTEARSIDGEDRTAFISRLPVDGDPSLLPLLHANEVELKVAAPEEPSPLSGLLVTMLPFFLLLGVWWWLSRKVRGSMGAGGPLAAMTSNQAQRYDREASVPVRMSDVAGLDGPKRELGEVVEFLRDAEPFERLGVRVPRGVLLAGPPGTGKTLLARAVAGEANVPFFSTSGSHFIEMLVGVGAKRVREMFAACRKEAPAILFIDEIDAVGRRRGTGLGGGHDEREQTLNQLLSEMDGFEGDSRVIVIACTNRPDVLDPALLRPGRFDRQVTLDLPARQARHAILQLHSEDKPLADDVDLEGWSRRTAGLSGADLANLTNEAALFAARRRRDQITEDDFAEAFDKALMGNVRELVLKPDDRRRIAIHESGHALTAACTDDAEPPRRMTIIPRGRALGATQQRLDEDRVLMSEERLRGMLRVLLGGMVAEELVLESRSSGAEDDLKKATGIARRMVATFGMSDAIGPVHLDDDDEKPFLGQALATGHGVSNDTRRLIEDEVQRFLVEAKDEVRALLTRHRGALDALVQQLLAHETLDEATLEAIVRDHADETPASTSSPRLRSGPRSAEAWS